MENPLADGCPIPNARGRVPAIGPVDAEIAFLGEAAGKREVLLSEPFVGPSGDAFERWLKQVGLARSQVRIGNCILCEPPRDWLVNAPWEQAALDHCRPQLEAFLAGNQKVVVTLGGTALRAVMGTPRARSNKAADGGVRVLDFHGSPMRSRDDRYWIVPTFHPAFLQRNQQKFLKTVIHDLEVAKELAAGKWKMDYPNLVIDPAVPWFEQWVDNFLQNPGWLAVDIETPDKESKIDEGDLGREDVSYEILCVNLSCNVGEGITVPWHGPYITLLKRLLENSAAQIYWNAIYDVPRLLKAGVNIPWNHAWDFMNAWHVLHSSMPKGLGFVAPFYSRTGPWKHLGSRNTTYRAMDGVQTLRCAFGIMETLQQTGMWDTAFHRHNHLLDAYVLRPAEAAGLPLNADRLEKFGQMLDAEEKRIEQEITVPQGARKLSKVYKIKPKKLKPGEELIEWVENIPALSCPMCKQTVPEEKGATHGKSCKWKPLLTRVSKGLWTCTWCGTQTTKPHTCSRPREEMERGATLQKTLWQKRLPFNPRSWQQVLEYIRTEGLSAGRNRKTGKETTDKKTIKKLAKKGDPFFNHLQDFRAVTKMKGTYADPILKRLDSSNRLHGTFIHGPSTMRLASRDPNLQNLAHHVKYASDFRRCVEASPGSIFVTADFAAIEAVLTGYFMGDPNYIRLAKLGVHACLATHILEDIGQGKAADMRASDDELRALFKEVKHSQKVIYNQAKRTVHGYNYGLTSYGLQDQFPELFPTKKDAQRVIDIYERMVPGLKKWQSNLRQQASSTGVIGPQGHPFGYRHHFYGVISWRKERGKWKEYLGEDSKRVVAFLPQSTAGGVLYEACLRLLDPAGENYIGDFWQGQTPVRALIHDEIFLEVDEAREQQAISRLVAEMSRPVQQLPCPREWGLGTHLQIGVSVKVGKNWADVDPDKEWSTDGNPEGMQEVDGVNEVAADNFKPEETEDGSSDDYAAA